MKETDLEILKERLISEAHDQLMEPPPPTVFTENEEANQLVSDINGYPHAFVIGCIMDTQIRSEKAWSIPYELRQRIGSFEYPFLSNLSLEDLKRVMEFPKPLHRFHNQRAKNLHAAIHRIKNTYCGNAAHIWADRPSSATIVRRFLEFDGIGQKIATMAANILIRDFRIPVRDCYSIDISVDVQIRRVFSRMGFVPEDASPDYIIFRAREMNPEYPGIFDVVLWKVGRTVCRPKDPLCKSCDWSAHCAFTRSGYDT